MHPFYLVYVRDDGTVRLGFAQPKQILELFRDLCLGHSAADAALGAMFDQETHDGASMQRYSDLLGAAARDIARRFRGRSIDRLQSGRDALLIPESQSTQDMEDFELVTWLVIR